MPDGRFVCDRSMFRYIIVLSLRWRAQSLSRIVSTKMSTIRFCDTSKGIRPVLRSSCSSRVHNYCDSKRRSRARGVINVPIDAPALRGARFFFVLPCCVGMPVLHFSAPLRRRDPFLHFSVNSQMIRTCLQINMKMMIPIVRVHIYKHI